MIDHRPLRHRLAWALSAVVLCVARGAAAGDSAMAEQLFREGRAQLDAGNYSVACPKLEESFAQDPATGTLLAVALCQEMSGKTASAWANFGEVAARSRRDGRSDREQAARDHQTALEPKLSRLAIEVDANTAALPGLQVTRDGTSVGAAAWGASLPCDPGQHTISVTAPGKERWTTTVTLGAVSDVQTVSVPALREAASVGSSQPTPNEAPTPPPGNSPLDSALPVDHAESRFPLRTVGIVAVGAGLLAVVATDAERLVDQQHVGRFADAVVDQELRRLGIHVDRAAEAVLAIFDELVDLTPAGHVGERLFAQLGLPFE